MSTIYDVKIIENKDLLDLTIKEIATMHLNYQMLHRTETFLLESGLDSAITAMIHGRGFIRMSSYTPYMNACAILDQLGGCYQRKDNNNNQKNNFKSALRDFSDLSENIINALYLLRNCLMHDASYCGKSRPDNKWSIFRNNENINEIIQTPNQPWNGPEDFPQSENITFINIRKFTNLVQDIPDKIFEFVKNDQIEFKQDSKEMILKFFYLHAKN